MTIEKILLAFQKSKGLSGRKFAEAAGLDPSQYNKYIKGINEPTITTLEKIKEAFPDFNYSGDIIITEPPMIWSVKAKTLPVYDLYTTPPKGKDGYDLKHAKVIDYFAIPMFSDSVGYIQVKDDSCKGLLNVGDYAAIYRTKLNAVVLGDKYLIIFNDPTREPIIRFVRKGTTPNHWNLKSINPDYDDFEFPIARIKEVFLVKGGVLAR